MQLGWLERRRQTVWLGRCLAILTSALLAVNTVPALASPANSVLIVDDNTGAVLFSQNAEEIRFPASLTKMMTLYIVFEKLEEHKLSPASRIKISANAAAAQPSRLELPPGDDIAVMDAVRALITKSANDIAIAMAENIAGSEPAFAQMMNQKAQRLGLKNTFFKNASGLPDEQQTTTAHDMVLLAQHLSNDYPQLYKLFATKTFTYAGHTHRNHNNLLFNFAGTDGIKTGYISRSGFNLVASVRRGNRHVIGAIFGGQTAGARDQLMRRLLSAALARASDQPRKPILAAAPGSAPPRLVRAPKTTESSSLPWLQPPAPQAEVAKPRPAEERKINPPVEIATVRPVLVGPQVDEAASRRALSRPESSNRGQAPSTLQAQANGLNGQSALQPIQVANAGSIPPAHQRPAADHKSMTPHANGFMIQIGAYVTVAEADRHLADAKAAAGAVLEGHPPVTQAINKDNHQLYRARFTGFEQSSAASVCNQLRQRHIDCMVLKAE